MKGLNVKNTGGIMPKFKLFEHPDTHMFYILRRADELTPNVPGTIPYLFLPPGYRTKWEAMERLEALNRADRFNPNK